jgi:hypothetical protein
MSPYLLEDNGAVLWVEFNGKKGGCDSMAFARDVTIEANGEERKVK